MSYPNNLVLGDGKCKVLNVNMIEFFIFKWQFKFEAVMRTDEMAN